ncbi:hypothetical protein [Burkholderia diffusa]|uniref:hypothetical protein n=1 Tax=Burkholderia diffusa TaxID=488732 RepID=UPI0009BD834A|nr:hypothetical protein [Burkholderia diffusa]
MDKKTVAERLRALASDDKKRSKAARLRDVIDDVEATLAAGVSRSDVVEELAKHGLEMTLTTFETTLRRIRQKRGRPSIAQATLAGQPARPAKPQEAAQVVETPPEPETPAPDASYNPADIDRIMSSTPDLDALAKLAKKRKVK